MKWLAAGTAVGVLLMAFGVWSLLKEDPITGYLQHRTQKRLRVEVRGRPVCAPADEGRAIGVLRIPSIRVDEVVVEGTSKDDLRRGPGHYHDSGLPGSGRTILIAGHRTTWGAPFRHLHEVERGDAVIFCRERYIAGRTIVVRATDWRPVIAARMRETLLVSTCHPVYSATHRLIVVATKEAT